MATASVSRHGSTETGTDYDLLVNGISVPFQKFDLELEYVDAEDETSDRKRSYYTGTGSFIAELTSEYAHDLFVDFGDRDVETVSMFLQGADDALWMTGVSVDSYERLIDVNARTEHRINWSASHIRFAD